MSKLVIQVKKTKKQNIILPFNGTIYEDLCCAIRLNYRLHTQCTKKRDINCDYCKTCRKHIDPKTKMPPYGDIRDRAKVGLLDYVDPQGKQTVPYYKILTTLKVTQEQVVEEAKRQNYDIPDINWDKQEVKKRGRPKKETVVENGFHQEQEKLLEEFMSSKTSKDQIHVRTFYHSGKIYLKSDSNGVWDIDTEKYVGYFDATSNTIVTKTDFDNSDE